MKHQVETLDEMLFEHRNRAYGAYQLRKMYQKTLRQSMVAGIGIALFVAGSSFVYLRKNEKVVTIETITEFNPKNLPPPEPPKEVLPPLPPSPPPAPVVEKVIVFTIPEPVIDELAIIEVPPPTQNDLQNAHIGTKAIDGTDVTATLIYDTPPSLQPPKDTGITKIADPTEVFTAVEINPEFVGGTAEMYRWLGRNIAYPSAAQRAGVGGKVFLSFIIEKDGSITAVKTLKGIGFGCDEEAERVVKNMPKWSPGKQNGKAVRVQFTIPIQFLLEN